MKIAALTASAAEGEREEVMAAGFDDFIRKPFAVLIIFDCMARHLDLRYRWAEVVDGTAHLTPEVLQALPEPVRDALRSAVISLNAKRVADAIRQIEIHDSALGCVLTQYADRFAYTAILNAVDGHGTSGPATSGLPSFSQPQANAVRPDRWPGAVR